MKTKIIYLLIGLGILLVFYLSWIPNPRIAQTINIPFWLKEWVDAPRNDTIRTGVPFLGLGLLIGLLLKFKNKKIVAWVWSLILLTLVAVFSELGQFFLPLRNCDYRDVLWAFFGAFAGLISAHLIWELFRIKIKK